MKNKKYTVVKSKEQADQIFNDMKQQEVERFNFNHNETEKIIKEISDKLHSEKMVRDLKELESLKKHIVELINIATSIGLTIHEISHFEETEHYPKRNIDYNEKAIKFLKNSLKAVKDRIKKHPESTQSNEPDHSELLTALSKHVTGIKPKEFTNIIKNHKLTGTKQAIWIKKNKSEAAYFAKVFNFTMPEFNICFRFEDGKKLTGGMRPTTKKPFKELLKPFIK